MAVPYETAISTIQSVLNNSMEREIICAVLEANNGHMERTIEQLLSMSGEIPPEEATIVDQNTVTQNQMREDALYAKMLQDQYFMNQLRLAPEFSEIFGNSQNNLRTSNSGTNKDDLQIIAEKLKGLGETAKLKFKELTLKFKKTTDKPNVQYTAINNNDDDSEVVAFDSSITKRTATSFEEEEPNEEEVPLTSRKSNTNLQSSGSSDSIVNRKTNTNQNHHKDD